MAQSVIKSVKIKDILMKINSYMMAIKHTRGDNII